MTTLFILSVIFLLLWLVRPVQKESFLLTPFFNKLPYRSLSARHYKKRWQTKTTPKCLAEGTCPPGPGYYQNRHQYFDIPNHHRNFYFGHSLYGTPYQTMPIDPAKTTEKGSRKYYDLLRYPEYKYQYPNWYDYTPKKSQQWHSGYIGFPWYYY